MQYHGARAKYRRGYGSRLEVTSRFLKQGGIVLDVGTHIATMAMAFAHFVGPSGYEQNTPAAHVRMYALHAAAVGAASNADPAVVRYVIGFEPNYPDFLLAQAPAHALNRTAQPCRLPGSWRSTARAAPHRSAWPQPHAHCAARKRQAR